MRKHELLKALAKPLIKKNKTARFVGADGEIRLDSKLKHIGLIIFSAHENDLGLVTHININFADVHKTVIGFECNIYPHEFDTLEILLEQSKDKERIANKDLKHRYWVFCEKRKQVNIFEPYSHTQLTT